MTALSILCAVLFGGLAVSYAWGIRGCVIGGEKGAMLPGALLGYCVAMFCGDGMIAEYWPFFCAAGALSMFYGGTETYAQTMSFILMRDKKESFAYNNMKKGIIGIFLKGGLWFGICATVLAMLPFAFNGGYSKNQIVIMFLLIPIVSLLGTKLFNSPYDKNKGIYPKLYFSHTRREEWGSNVLILLVLCFFAVFNRDYFSLLSALCGFVCGGFGFTLGLLAYDFTVRKHNGKYLFGSLQEKGYIDGWKIMEHFFGAFSGGGLMLWFVLNSKQLTIDTENFFPQKGSYTDIILSIIVVVMLLLTAIQYPITSLIKKKSGKAPDNHIFEIAERPLLSAIPLIFVFLGYCNSSICISLVTLTYLLCEKCGLEWFSEFKSAKAIRFFYALFFVVITAYAFIANFRISSFVFITILVVSYTGSVFLYSNIKDRRIDRKNKGLGYIQYYKCTFTVDYHFLAESIAIIAVAGLLSVGGFIR